MIRARQTFSFTPTGEAEIPLTFYGSILTDSGYSRRWQGSGGSVAVYGSPFGALRAEGGRVLRVSWTQLLRFHTMSAAELTLHARELYLHQHPEGIVRELYAYANGVPGGSHLWRGVLEEFTYQPPRPEDYLGRAAEPAWQKYLAALSPDGEDTEGQAWVSLDVSFILAPIGNEP